MQPSSLRQRRQLVRAAMALCILVVIGASGTWLAHPGQRANAAYTPTKLLLIHGFDDTCQYAFNKIGNANQGPYPTTAAAFLGSSGWSNPWAGIDQVGYYDPTVPISGLDTGGNPYTTYDSTPKDSPAGNCDHSLNEYSDPNNTDPTNGKTTHYDPNTSNCAALAGPDSYILDVPIRHIACVFAWYVYDTYTKSGIDVNILAHSMGGLVVRDAIGESGQGTCSASVCNGYFPPGRLMVTRVVTVATPHGGEAGFYLDEAKAGFVTPQGYTNAGNVVREVQDMDPTSTGDGFMQHVGSFQAPQGVVPPGTVPPRTYWALMAGSNSSDCVINGTGFVSCQADNSGKNNPYPDGDGVVQSDSQLSMQADFKILYGKGTCIACGGNQQDVLYEASGSSGDSQYSHEANTCRSNWFLFIKFTGCLSNPFYLNDGTPANQTTYAWICSYDTTPCPNTGGITDLKVVVNGQAQLGQTVAHSLAEIASLLPPPGPPPTPTPTPTTPPRCSITTETDNTQEGGYTDNRGNTWYVYFDIKRDTPTGLPCQMRVVVRIFDPGPDGKWNGTADVWAAPNGGNRISASFGKVSGGGTYQYHFVWRGPWFNVSSGSYYIQDDEYNGSNAYPRAYGSFSI